MTGRRISPRARAIKDIDEAIEGFLGKGSFQSAQGFVDELQAVFTLLIDHPHIGSPRYAHELNVPGLRHRKLRRYPWLVLYVAQSAHIEIVRVLDARRDIPATLLGGDVETDD